MRAAAAALLLLLLSSVASLAQAPVSVIGPTTPGHCVSFFSTTQLQDAGGACGIISGPGVSTVGDLAVWSNTTGTALADTGLSFPGGFSFAGTLTGATAVTFPTSGTLATTAQLVPLPVSLTNGGTNNALTASAGGIVWSDATKLNVLAGTVTAGQCLISGSSATPSWGACGGGGGGTPGGASTNVQFNNAGAFGGDSGFTYAGAGQVTQALGTITTNKIALNVTGTWNAAGITFDAPLLMTITNTASAVGSTLFDFKVGATSLLLLQPNTNAIMSLGDGATASAFRVYNSVDTLSGPTNFERGVLDWTTVANTLTIGTQAGGTGTKRGMMLSYGGGIGEVMKLGLSAANTSGMQLDFNSAAQNFIVTYINVSGAGDVFFQGVGAAGTTYLEAYNCANGMILGTGGNSAPIVFKVNRTEVARVTSVLGLDAHTAGTYIQWGGEARVTADFSVTSSVALVSVTGLSVNVAAGRSYQFVAELYVTDAAAGGVQAAIAGTATATAIQYVGFAIADNAIKAKTNATALATAVASTVTTETAGIIVRITGTITVNAAGTLTVQMAQNTSNATPTIAKRGSWLLVNDMP